MPDLRTQLRDYFEAIAPPVSPEEARRTPVIVIPAPATATRPRRLLPIVVGLVVVVLAVLAAGLLRPQTPQEPVIGPTPTTVPVEEPTTSALPSVRVDQAVLARARWVTHGPDGLRTDDGTLLWETEFVGGTTFVARDGEGGLVYVDGKGLWWIAPGAETPRLVAGEEVLLPDPTLVEVIPTFSGPVARIGFSDSRYLDLTTGALLAEGPRGRVQSDGSWVTANGLGVRIVGPEVTRLAEGGIDEVLEPAHLVVEQGDELLADVVVGTVREPFAMVLDFDGRTLILFRFPHEPALPAVPYFVIDLGCADCLVTFQAGDTWVALVGSDTDWSGPVETPMFLDASSQSPEDAARDGVVQELAALPNELRISQYPEIFGNTRIETDEGVWMISRPIDSGTGAEGCGLGDPNGVYGLDLICLVEYGEVLLLDAETQEILRAYPFPTVPPQALAITDDAVYCVRQGDGALPDSMLCRIDRATLQATVRVFPWHIGSTFGSESEQHIPANWTIDQPTDLALWEQMTVDGDSLTIEGYSGSARVDPLTLELSTITEAG